MKTRPIALALLLSGCLFVGCSKEELSSHETTAKDEAYYKAKLEKLVHLTPLKGDSAARSASISLHFDSYEEMYRRFQVFETGLVLNDTASALAHPVTQSMSGGEIPTGANGEETWIEPNVTGLGMRYIFRPQILQEIEDSPFPLSDLLLTFTLKTVFDFPYGYATIPGGALCVANEVTDKAVGYDGVGTISMSAVTFTYDGQDPNKVSPSLLRSGHISGFAQGNVTVAGVPASFLILIQGSYRFDEPSIPETYSLLMYTTVTFKG